MKASQVAALDSNITRVSKPRRIRACTLCTLCINNRTRSHTSSKLFPQWLAKQTSHRGAEIWYVTIGYKVRRDHATALHFASTLYTETLLDQSC